jgi:hypothetical protein
MALHTIPVGSGRKTSERCQIVWTFVPLALLTNVLLLTAEKSVGKSARTTGAMFCMRINADGGKASSALLCTTSANTEGMDNGPKPGLTPSLENAFDPRGRLSRPGSNQFERNGDDRSGKDLPQNG